MTASDQKRRIEKKKRKINTDFREISASKRSPVTGK